MSLWNDPKYRALAAVAAGIMGSKDGDIIAAILAQWTCEKGNADAYPPSRNNPGNLARGAASGLGYPFHVDYPNPQPGNPIVTFATPGDGARAYGKLIHVGSRYAGVRAAVAAGNGHAYIVAMGKSGYGTSTGCMLSAYHPPAPQPTPKPEPEDPVGLTFRYIDRIPGTVVVNGAGHALITVAEQRLVGVPAGQARESAGRVVLLAPVKGHEGSIPAGTEGWLVDKIVGGTTKDVQAALVLVRDGTFTP